MIDKRFSVWGSWIMAAFGALTYRTQLPPLKWVGVTVLGLGLITLGFFGMDKNE